MTPEEMNRAIEFIVEHQAKFAADIQKLFESDKGLREADARLRESQATLTGAVIRITELLEQSQRQTDEHFERLDERLLKLADAQHGTEERLNALINVVERHITGPDHGRKRRR